MNKPYRPSNGTEGMVFEETFCHKCTKEDGPDGNGCKIMNDACVFEIDEPEYPSEWIYDSFGYPVCTAFERKTK